MQAVTTALSGLIGSDEDAATASPPALAATKPANALAAAEEMAAAAERVQAIAIAAAQASRIKPVIVNEAPPPVVVPAEFSPTQKLADWVRENAVFFANGTELRDQVAANRDLNQLTALLARTKARIRVVGYTDDRGDSRRNAQLALERAETVRRLLLDRGVSADRMIAHGRTTGADLSQKSGPDSPNRRVEFEFAFRNEQDP